MSGSKILLVGGSGFLGTHLMNRLVSEGCQVGIFDKSPPKSAAESVEFFQGELCEKQLLRSALSNYKRIIYLAHESTSAPTADQDHHSFTKNLNLFVSVLHEAIAQGASDFCLFSSGGAVYGDDFTEAISEESPTNPVSAYGVCKLCMEKYLAMAAKLHGFRHIIVRPSNPYGPGQNFNGLQGLIAISMARIARGEAIKLYGDGSAVKDFIYVDDLTGAVLNLLKNPRCTGVFNIGSGQGHAVKEVLELIGRALNKTPLLERHPSRRGDVNLNILNISKIKSSALWQPEVCLEAGLQKTWRWMKPQL